MIDQAATQPLLRVEDLKVQLTDGTPIVDGVGLTVNSGEIVGIVGESGAGKSMTALAVVQMLPRAAHIAAGRVLFDGQDLAGADAKSLRRIRGGQIGMVFQDPLSSLNPVMKIGAQIEEALLLHGSGRADARRRAVELLGLVGIREPTRAVNDYPHEFSGGMRQRVMIAIAVANNPRLVIADEPTTGLDVTIQAEVLALLMRMREEVGVAVMLITHDIGVVEEICDRTTVLYAGRVVENGGRRDVFSDPRHPYTAQLIRSVPQLHGDRSARLPVIPGSPAAPGEVSAGCPFAPRCAFVQPACLVETPELVEVATGRSAACLRTADGSPLPPFPGSDEPPPAAPRLVASALSEAADRSEPIIAVNDLQIRYGAGRRRNGSGSLPAVDGVSLTVDPGRVLGLIGESGSGKTSIARAMVGLVKPSGGTISVEGVDWSKASREQVAQIRSRVQLVFQDSLAAMDPRWRVRQIVSEPLRGRAPGFGLSLEGLVDAVGLDARLLDRYPDELSGGQRQRVGIARALSIGPRVIIADEPVSALDVSVQAQVINLLADLRDNFGVGLVIVAHDLAVAWHIADDIAVMQNGRIVEFGPTEQVLGNPQEPYTQALIASIPGESAVSAAVR